LCTRNAANGICSVSSFSSTYPIYVYPINMCMYVYLYTYHICTHVLSHTYTHTPHTRTHTHTHKHTHTHTHTHLCVYSTCVSYKDVYHTHTYIHAYLSIDLCVCVCVYTYISTGIYVWHTGAEEEGSRLQCQKRPTTVSKETYYSVKRDLLQCQKRPTTVSKETYYSVEKEDEGSSRLHLTLCIHVRYITVHMYVIQQVQNMYTCILCRCRGRQRQTICRAMATQRERACESAHGCEEGGRQ
jgi:hypothetical protein